MIEEHESMKDEPGGFVPCGVALPWTDTECMLRRGHYGDHGVELWPDGFQKGQSRLVEWNNDGQITYDEREEAPQRDDD